MPGHQSWTFRCCKCGRSVRCGPATIGGKPLKMKKADVRWLDALWHEGWDVEDGHRKLRCPKCRKKEAPRKLKTPQDVPHLGGFSMLPTPAGTCAECGVAHAPGQPHNRDSLAYQYAFYGKHERWPTWKDAMAHCPHETQAAWLQALEGRGVVVG